MPAKDDEIQRMAASLNDNVKWLAAAHCTGEPAFAILQKTFDDRFLYAGVGTVLPLSAGPGARTLRGEAAILGGDDLAAYREFADGHMTQWISSLLKPTAATRIDRPQWAHACPLRLPSQAEQHNAILG